MKNHPVSRIFNYKETIDNEYIVLALDDTISTCTFYTKIIFEVYGIESVLKEVIKHMNTLESVEKMESDKYVTAIKRGLETVIKKWTRQKLRNTLIR